MLLACLPLPAEEKDKEKATLGTIERLDPAFDDLIGKDAVLEKLAGGFAWTEGPVWDKKGKYLLFSDIPNNSVFKYKEGEKVKLFLKPSGYTGSRTDFLEPGSNGLLIDSEGRLILMQHGDRRVARLRKINPEDRRELPKLFETLADKYDGKRLNSPNDGVFAKNGDLYFTDPPYGRMLRDKKKGGPVIKDGELYFPGRELDFCGVYRLTKGGKLTLLTKTMSKPNGIAFSPDEKTLYVANSDPKKAIWMSFPVKKDGTLDEDGAKVFFNSTKWVPKKKGLPDGMKVDRKGNLFATGPGGVLVFTPEGKHLGTIATGVPTANCAWGDDGTVLYVTADKDLCRIKTKTKGLGF
jgi:gluconolactonase